MQLKAVINVLLKSSIYVQKIVIYAQLKVVIYVQFKVVIYVKLKVVICTIKREDIQATHFYVLRSLHAGICSVISVL